MKTFLVTIQHKETVPGSEEPRLTVLLKPHVVHANCCPNLIRRVLVDNAALIKDYHEDEIEISYIEFHPDRMA